MGPGWLIWYVLFSFVYLWRCSARAKGQGLLKDVQHQSPKESDHNGRVIRFIVFGSQTRSPSPSESAIRYLIYFVHTWLICSNEFCHPEPDPDDLKNYYPSLGCAGVFLFFFFLLISRLHSAACHTEILIIRGLRWLVYRAALTASYPPRPQKLNKRLWVLNSEMTTESLEIMNWSPSQRKGPPRDNSNSTVK